MTSAEFLQSLTRFRRVQPKVGRVHARLLRLSRGRIRRSRLLAGGQPVLALTTTGRRSGARRTTVVAYVRHGGAYAVGALNLGSDHDPAWCLNLRADPRAWVQVDGERIAVTARHAAGREAEALWQTFIDRLPAIASSRALARRDVPMLVLDPRPPVTMTAVDAAHHETSEQQDDDHTDQGAEDAAQVERVVVTDTEAGGENRPAKGRTDQAEDDRD
jgi:deazaflavin-dependent oxidoreductase (nitroreductase family)